VPSPSAEMTRVDRGRRVKVMHWPVDPGPYQHQLAVELERLGVESTFVVEPTRSQTLNVALLPLWLAIGRAQGASVLNIHWLFRYHLAWARGPRRQRLLLAHLHLVLASARALGLTVVWTAHNVVPHQPIFHDDETARRLLVRWCALVLAHDAATAAELQARFDARRISVIPQGATPPAGQPRTEARGALGVTDQDLVLAIAGRIAPYKGVDLALEAIAAALEADPMTEGTLVVVVAGAPDSPATADAVTRAAEAVRRAGGRVDLELRRVSDAEFGSLLSAADLALMNFQSVTNSGSIAAALAAHCPVLTTDLSSIRSGFGSAVVTADGSRRDLVAKLNELRDPGRRRSLATAAADWAEAHQWSTVAQQTADAYAEALTYARQERLSGRSRWRSPTG